jgi:hypothetical protein
MISARAVWEAMFGDVRLPRRTMACGGGVPASAASPLGTIPAAMDVMHSSPPAQCMDRWTFRHLGVSARRGYGMYGGALTWLRTTSRLECAPAFVSKNNLLSRFSKLIFSTF